jgi:hypothetical protein
MRKNGNIYEYIAVYVGDLAIAMKTPKKNSSRITKNYSA